LDNLGKALLDALAAAGVYEDDSQIDDFRIIRCPVVSGGKVLVVIHLMEGSC
jgi:crossover junction endodeoxyribonuclease RusA